jgi:small subunit ribosomal protein S6
MQFDSSIRAQQEVQRTLSLDPRMIRYSIVKVGDKLGGVNGAIEEVTGEIPWNSQKREEMIEPTLPNQPRFRAARGA